MKKEEFGNMENICRLIFPRLPTMKPMRRDIFQKQTLNGFCFDVEILQIAKIKGYKIKEIPVIWKNAEGSTVKPIKDSLKMFKDLIKIKLNTLKGLYD